MTDTEARSGSAQGELPFPRCREQQGLYMTVVGLPLLRPPDLALGDNLMRVRLKWYKNRGMKTLSDRQVNLNFRKA